MIDKNIFDEIQDRLVLLESEENVKILYACESGSRAWGFPSSDSDYDVRFLYLRTPDWYLSIDEGRDVIEREITDQIDLSGWDLKKALRLYRKSNPPLIEWLKSPIVYLEKYSIAQEMRNLLSQFYSPLSSMYHYFHMAEGNFRDYLKHDEVWVKKYFYVLRPILACLWIENSYGPVPTEFEVLVEKTIKDTKLKSEINNLISEKKKGKELSWGPRVPEISNFIETQISRFENRNFNLDKSKPDTNILNNLFRLALKEVWNNI